MVAILSRKAAVSLKRGKIGARLLLMTKRKTGGQNTAQTDLVLSTSDVTIMT